jgi:hypothetical protein
VSECVRSSDHTHGMTPLQYIYLYMYTYNKYYSKYYYSKYYIYITHTHTHTLTHANTHEKSRYVCVCVCVCVCVRQSMSEKSLNAPNKVSIEPLNSASIKPYRNILSRALIEP